MLRSRCTAFSKLHRSWSQSEVIGLGSAGAGALTSRRLGDSPLNLSDGETPPSLRGGRRICWGCGAGAFWSASDFRRRCSSACRCFSASSCSRTSSELSAAISSSSASAKSIRRRAIGVEIGAVRPSGSGVRFPRVKLGGCTPHRMSEVADPLVLNLVRLVPRLHTHTQSRLQQTRRSPSGPRGTTSRIFLFMQARFALVNAPSAIQRPGAQASRRAFQGSQPGHGRQRHGDDWSKHAQAGPRDGQPAAVGATAAPDAGQPLTWRPAHGSAAGSTAGRTARAAASS